MSANDAMVDENVPPEVVKQGTLELRQDLLGRDYKGKSSEGIAKKTSGLIKKLQPALAKFLEPNEQVLYIARVQRHVSGVTQYTMGWYVYYASATVIVLTNRHSCICGYEQQPMGQGNPSVCMVRGCVRKSGGLVKPALKLYLHSQVVPGLRGPDWRELRIYSLRHRFLHVPRRGTRLEGCERQVGIDE